VELLTIMVLLLVVTLLAAMFHLAFRWSQLFEIRRRSRRLSAAKPADQP
jgi:hypothetical protein